MSSPTTETNNISQIIDILLEGVARDLEIAQKSIDRASYVLKGAATSDVFAAKEEAAKKVGEIFEDIRKNPQKAVSIFCDGIKIDAAAKDSLQKIKAAFEEAKNDSNKTEEFTKTLAESNAVPDSFLHLATTMIGAMAKSGALGQNIGNIANVISLFENIIEKDGRTAAGDLAALMSGLAGLDLQANPLLAAIVQEALKETFGESSKLFSEFAAEEIDAEVVESAPSLTEEIFAIGSIIASITIPAPFGMIAAEAIEEVGHYVEEHGGLEEFAKEISDTILPKNVDDRDLKLKNLESEVAKPQQPLESYTGKSEVDIAAQIFVDEKASEMKAAASSLSSSRDLIDRITIVPEIKDAEVAPQAEVVEAVTQTSSPVAVTEELNTEDLLFGEVKEMVASMKDKVSSKESQSPSEIKSGNKENVREI